MVRTLRVRIRFRRPSLPHCGQGAFLGPQGIGITTTVGASVPMLASLVRGGLSTTTFHQGACPNVQAQNGFEPPTIRWRSSRSLANSLALNSAATFTTPFSSKRASNCSLVSPVSARYYHGIEVAHD